MKLDILGAVIRHLAKLGDRADGMAVSAGAFPDIKRRSPISVTGKTPVLNVLKPVAESSLTDILGNPVYGIVISYEAVLYLCHLYKPAVAGVVDKRRVTSPAMRIIVLELGRGEKLALLFEVNEYRRIRLLYEESRVGRLRRHLTLGINELYEGKVVSLADLGVVLTECGRDVYDTRTVGHRDVIIHSHEVRALLLLLRSLGGASPKRLVATTLKITSLHLCEYLVRTLAVLCKRSEHLIKKRLSHIIGIAVARLYLAVDVVGVYAKRGVRGERPGRGRPRKIVRVLV